MVKIQIDIDEEVSQLLDLYCAVNKMKDKRKGAERILRERLEFYRPVHEPTDEEMLQINKKRR